MPSLQPHVSRQLSDELEATRAQLQRSEQQLQEEAARRESGGPRGTETVETEPRRELLTSPERRELLELRALSELRGGASDGKQLLEARAMATEAFLVARQRRRGGESRGLVGPPGVLRDELSSHLDAHLLGEMAPGPVQGQLVHTCAQLRDLELMLDEARA